MMVADNQRLTGHILSVSMHLHHVERNTKSQSASQVTVAETSLTSADVETVPPHSEDSAASDLSIMSLAPSSFFITGSYCAG